MLSALASGNAQAFQESKDEFNKNYELAVSQVTGSYQGNPTAAMQQFNQQLAQTASQFAQTFGLNQQGQAQQNAVNVAQLTGVYNAPGTSTSSPGGAGAPTAADFYNQPASVQQAYNQYHGATAVQDWVRDATAAQASAGGSATPAQSAASGQGQQTLASILQQANIAAQQAQLSGQYNGAPTEATREFNTQQQAQADQFAQTFGLSQGALTGQYNGAPTEAANEFNQNFGLSQGALTGQYNGAPTEAARQFNQSQQQQNSQYNASLAQSLLQAATQLRGPNDYLQYQNLTHGGQTLLGQLYGGGQAGASQPTGQLQSANLNNAIGDLGAGQALTGTGATIPQTGASAGAQPDPTTAALLASFGLSPGGTLNPGQIDPARWDAIGQVGQDLTKNLASTYFGYDPTDFQNQIDATRPKGTAARTTSTAYAQPTGLF